MTAAVRSVALLALVVGFAAVAPTVDAGGRKKAKPVEHHDTLISAVAPNSITITEDKTPKTFPINQSTEVYIRGQKATVAELQPGMGVSVTVAMDGMTASRISAVDAPIHNDREKVKVSRSFMK